MEATKRIRSTNWSEEEKKVLRMLVLARADVIEKKDTCTKTNRAKKLAWDEVLLRFNTISGNNRDLVQLLNQWRNMKNRAKTAFKRSERERGRSTIVTGEGPLPPSEDWELIEPIPIECAVDSNCYNSETANIRQEASTRTMTNPVSLSQKLLELEESQVSSESPAPILPETSQPWERPGPSYPVNKKQKKKNHQLDCCSESHEHQLFILARTAREEAMLREKEAHECKMINERELHERRMALMSLEEEYWQQKIRSLK